jgi:hypothetical protein
VLIAIAPSFISLPQMVPFRRFAALFRAVLAAIATPPARPAIAGVNELFPAPAAVIGERGGSDSDLDDPAGGPTNQRRAEAAPGDVVEPAGEDGQEPHQALIVHVKPAPHGHRIAAIEDGPLVLVDDELGGPAWIPEYRIYVIQHRRCGHVRRWRDETIERMLLADPTSISL